MENKQGRKVSVIAHLYPKYPHHDLGQRYASVYAGEGDCL